MSDAYQSVIDALGSCKRILLTTHVRPDGDALGTVAATILGLRKKGIEAEALLLSHLPSKYAFIFTENEIVHHEAEQGWPAKLNLKDFDAFLVMDTGTWSQLPGLKEKVLSFAGKKIVVDHHLTQEDWADIKLVDTTAAAAGEIATELLERWGVAMDGQIATALFLALVCDTGWFQFSNTKPHTLRMAADLISAGVDTDRIYQLLYQNERAERIQLHSRGMQSLELLAGGKLAVMTLKKSDFEQTGARVTDTEALINIPMQIASVQVSVLITEPTDKGPTRVSLRSKGQVDVAALAQIFGGGGHARAAGLKLDLSLSETRAQVVESLTKLLDSNC
ncbi:MAG TPA: bifunctional oligoribonuclease/PAP phosphatase NrnA [Tepidisphaeraceae bacterium]|nr:bifunctional oligoribonuclease/PAP phosphatase NrnA [Tepidisphaeraceae bacterium]